MVDTALELAGCAGPVHAVIGHSLGGLVALLAMQRGLRTRKAVLLSPSLRADHARERFAELFRLRPRAVGALVGAIDRRFGHQVWGELDGRRIASRLAAHAPDVPILMAHDTEDPDAPFSDTLAVSALLPRAQLMKVPGAGHHRTVHDPSVVAATVEFVSGRERAPLNGDAPIPVEASG
jgi:pimeloyl-ACP methyl ester carboxylesterase